MSYEEFNLLSIEEQMNMSQQDFFKILDNEEKIKKWFIQNLEFIKKNVENIKYLDENSTLYAVCILFAYNELEKIKYDR